MLNAVNRGQWRDVASQVPKTPLLGRLMYYHSTGFPPPGAQVPQGTGMGWPQGASVTRGAFPALTCCGLSFTGTPLLQYGHVPGGPVVQGPTPWQCTG